MRMPFADLKGVTFIEADRDRVVARMTVRPDLCTANNIIHGGAIMAFADSVGAAATVVNLPEDAKGTTTLESNDQFHRRRQGGDDPDCDRNSGASWPPHPGLDHAARDRGRQARCHRHADPDGAVAGNKTPAHSITSSAVANISGGMVQPHGLHGLEVEDQLEFRDLFDRDVG